jgi:hypothetical protein
LAVIHGLAQELTKLKTQFAESLQFREFPFDPFLLPRLLLCKMSFNCADVLFPSNRQLKLPSFP